MKEINEQSATVPPSSVVVVSEPLDQSMDNWKEVPPGTFPTIKGGGR